ncbi:protealysin inhibitor emfourin [Streptomyces sp.]|uniref:protealysin inhibitor emfourin n=1 Tax=Streptomyces sp. TaxID=1931 RepID=UPI002F3E69A7
MRIEVTRTGGFAGIPRRAVLETSGRPDGPHLESLAREVVSAAPARPAPGVPDGFSYEIAAAGRTVHFADPHLTPAQRELVQAVLSEGA